MSTPSFRHISLLITTTLLALPLLTNRVYAQQETPRPKDFHGVWVSTVSNIDFPSKPGRSAQEMRLEIDQWLDLFQTLRFNAVFLQVRPMGDAYYPSKIYPWSQFLSGKQGQAPDENFDPLKYWIEQAHARGIQLHAWINPYRVTIGKRSLDSLADSNPAKLHPEWTFFHNDRYYLNPGIPEVRKLVVDGIIEIVENYDVDGIHIDDYFYPERKIDEDANTFQEYGKDFDNIEDWRRNNVNLFIQETKRAIDQTNKDVLWSVSPAGIWANKSSHPLGSDTRGNQCYFDLYADVYTWIKNEWIDAVIPQIYWEIGYKIADFDVLLKWWSDVVKDVDVKLYVGMAAYRLDPKSTKEAWQTTENFKRQLELLDSLEQPDGQVFFTAHSFKNKTMAYELLKQYSEEHNWKKPEDK